LLFPSYLTFGGRLKGKLPLAIYHLRLKVHRHVTLKSYVAVDSEALARSLERYFKSGSGKAFANKRFWRRLAEGRPD